MKKFFFLIIALLVLSPSFCQVSKDLALEKKREAVDLMDNGNPDLAISLLEEAKKMDPGTYAYDYEIGFAYTIKKDYQKALEVFKNVLKYKDANDQCYQMLGNLYDNAGDPENALKTYDRGLKKFPESGKLYLEKGTVYWLRKNPAEALANYEQGIKVDPSFPSNYYRATQLLCSNSDEEVWGMIYGEIFLNLERNSKRTEEISKLLYDTYKSEIKFTSDTSFTVSFSKNATINLSINDLKHFNKLKLPFGSMIYEPTLTLSLIGEKKINLESLDRIRTKFITGYYEKNHNVKYPNVMFDYGKKLIELGYFQPYNYWLLSEGDPEGFKSWKENNSDTWDKFVEWFNANGLTLSKDNRFSRDQY